MNAKTKDLLGSAATATPVDRPTPKQLLESVARLFAGRPTDKFKLLTNVEYTEEAVVRAMKTEGTALQPVVNMLNAMGVPTENNADSVMHNLDLTKDDMHAFCDCNGGDDGDAISRRVGKVASEK